MSATNAAVRLIAADGTPLDVLNGVAVPAGTPALIPAVVDPSGSLTRYMRGDSVGRPDTLMGSWLGSTAPTVGQKGLADSIPVVLPTDQVINVTPAFPGADSPTYGASSGEVVVLKTGGTTTIINTLFNPLGSEKIIRLQRWQLTWGANAGNNTWTYLLTRITAENGTPGGTSITPQTADTNDGASIILFRSKPTGAPTRVAFPYVVGAHLGGSANNWAQFVERIRDGKAITLRPGQGLELRVVIGAANLGSDFGTSASYEWTETT